MRKKKTILLTQNFWNQHLSGTHCCWLLFRWCICRADHQSNSRFQLLLCVARAVFIRTMLTNKWQKNTPPPLSYDDTIRKWKCDFYGFQNWSWPLPPMSRYEPKSTASIGSWKETRSHLPGKTATRRILLEIQTRCKVMSLPSKATLAQHPSSGLPLRPPALSKQGKTYFKAPEWKHWW